MLDVLTGNSIASCLYPKCAPKNTKGEAMAHQPTKRKIMVLNGTAYELPYHQAKRSKWKKRTKHKPGNAEAVQKVALSRLVPSKVLTTHATHEDINEQSGHDDDSTLGRIQESQRRQENRPKGRTQELGSRPTADGEQERCRGRRSEDVSMDHLPSLFFHFIGLFFIRDQSIVTSQILSKISQ